MNNFRHLKWDSDFLGFNVAAIEVSNVDKNFEDILHNLKDANYKLIYTFSENQLEFTDNHLNFFNIIPIDIKLTYQVPVKKIINNKNIFKNSTNIISYLFNPLSSDLLNLTYQSGLYSRFKRDINFDSNVFFKLYKLWIDKSIRREFADEVFVFIDNMKILGFVSVAIKNNFGYIGLIAVDENARGKNIGRNLIEEAANFLNDSNIDELFVSTQYINKGACNFYSKIGFNLFKKQYIYHIWL